MPPIWRKHRANADANASSPVWRCFELGLQGCIVTYAPVSSYLAVSSLPSKEGGLISVALSLKSPLVGVTHNPAL